MFSVCGVVVGQGSLLKNFWIPADDVIDYGDNVWGRPTSLIPTSDGKVVYKTYSHVQTKDLTAADQFYLIQNHKTPDSKQSTD